MPENYRLSLKKAKPFWDKKYHVDGQSKSQSEVLGPFSLCCLLFGSNCSQNELALTKQACAICFEVPQDFLTDLSWLWGRKFSVALVHKVPQNEDRRTTNKTITFHTFLFVCATTVWTRLQAQNVVATVSLLCWKWSVPHTIVNKSLFCL